MSDMLLFQRAELGRVRCYIVDNEPWFLLKDVCECLDLSNPTSCFNRLDEDERSKFNLGRQGDANIVNEYGVYNLVLSSRKPEAKAFKRWITHDVIPSIRKKGLYGVTSDIKSMSKNELMAKALVVANETIERINEEREAERKIAQLRIEQANSQRDMAVRSKAYISSKREATLMGRLSGESRRNEKLVKENAELSKENEELKDKLSSGTLFMTVNKIPWIFKYMQRRPYRGTLKQDVFNRLGNALKILCERNNISLGEKEESDNGMLVNTYPLESIDLIEQYIRSKDEANYYYRFLSDYMLPEYRA